MTDNEIITIDDAISHCYETYFERDDLCRECREEHKQLAKWLEELKESRNTINRQKAEIERYKGVIKLLESDVATAKYEAIKEFADLVIKKVETVRQKYQKLCKEQGQGIDEVMNIHFNGMIDLVKEMTEV